MAIGLTDDAEPDRRRVAATLCLEIGDEVATTINSAEEQLRGRLFSKVLGWRAQDWLD